MQLHLDTARAAAEKGCQPRNGGEFAASMADTSAVRRSPHRNRQKEMFSTGGETKLVSGRSTTFYFKISPTVDPEGGLLSRPYLDALEGADIDLIGGRWRGCLDARRCRRGVSQNQGVAFAGILRRKQAKEHGRQEAVEGLAQGESSGQTQSSCSRTPP